MYQAVGPRRSCHLVCSRLGELTVGREVHAHVHGEEVVALPLAAVLGCEGRG